MNKNEFYNKLKQKRADQVFWKSFDEELSKIISAKKAGTYEESNIRHDQYKEIKPFYRPKEFTVENDDKFHTKLWSSFLKDCAFYFDSPLAEDKVELKNKIQFRYDSLFSSSWRAPINNRRELLLWACNQRNTYMTEKGNEGGVEECEFNSLVEKYGPDYEPLNDKLGFIKGLFD